MDTHTHLNPLTTQDPFGLAELPPPPEPENAWPLIERALKRRQRTRRSLVWLASAATVALALGLYVQLPVGQPGEVPETAAITTIATQDIPERKVSSPDDNLRALVRLSQQLEKNLRLVRAEVGAMPAQSVMYQVELEDLVAQLDEAISQRPDSRELWSQRVNLLLDLNQLYQVQLRRDYRNVASL